MINCMVIDDELHSIEVLEHYIGQTGMLRLVATCDNPVRGLELLREHSVDVIFLDIHMPQMTGLDFIRAINRRYKIVLCTAYPDYALEGFELDVIDYLVKPIPLPRFLRTVEKLIEATPGGLTAGATADDFILVKTGVRGSMTRIDLSSIIYAEGRKNYVAIHHRAGNTLALLSMKELEERLPVNSFMRVHKSFIVAIRQIAAIEGNLIRLKDTPAQILVGESYRQKFFDAMSQYLLGRNGNRDV